MNQPGWISLNFSHTHIARHDTVDLLNYCLDHMLSPQESIGVQALSIRIAYLLCRKEPELLQELQLILENTELDFYSTGVRTTVRNTLKKIRATKGRE